MLIGAIIVLWVIALSFTTPAFLSAGSLQALLVATAPVALMGIGMTIIIITGGIDVSVGGAVMVCSAITAKLCHRVSLPRSSCWCAGRGGGSARAWSTAC